MNNQLAMVLTLLVSAIVMFAINKPRMDAVALIVLTLLPFTGVLTMGEALAGFADSNIVLIAALFVIGDGLVRTGVARKLGDWLTRTAGTSETRLIALLMVVVCGLGSMMSSTAVTAIFIPVALRISQSTGTSPKRLMMPLSFAALISGMMTLVATAPNLVVSSELERNGYKGFHFFSFTPFGVPVLILGVAYMMFARRLLGGGTEAGQVATSGKPTMAAWVDEYKLASREMRARVSDGSALIGKKIGEIRPQGDTGSRVVAIERAGTLMQASDESEFHAGDVLLIDLGGASASVVSGKYGLEELALSGAYFTDRSQEIGMAAVILPAMSEFVGKTIDAANLRDRFGLTVVGLKRGKGAVEGPLNKEVLKLGDELLLIGPWKAIGALQSGARDVVLLDLPAERADVLPVASKAPQALASLFVVVVLMVWGIVPNVQAAFIGCLMMGALGCINLESAYRSIDWKTLVLIVGMLPFSIALQRTGG
ncbi:MAG: SLC13 family permease, partial [Phycisphaerales bacterium]|nr:SLC13 family permease [Phycisphaerales bacterium]